MATVVQLRTLAPYAAEWTGSVTLDQADPASGVQSIALSLIGTLSSSVWIYSLERSASDFSSMATATVSLERPDGSVLLAADPSATVTAVLPAAAGLASRGVMLQGAGSATVGAAYGPNPTASPDAALLIGTGTITLPVSATARVHATAPGNFAALFDSQVGAAVSDAATTTGQPGGTSMGSSGSDYTSYEGYGLLPVAVVGLITTPVQHVQITPSTTGWSQALGIAGFDPALGRLRSVNVTLTANAVASLQAENIEAVAGTLRVNQTATIDLDANGAVLDSQAAAVVTSEPLSAFDGGIDDVGASGETIHGQTASQAAMASLSSSDVLAAFTGPAVAGVTVASVGQTTIEGPGALSIAAALQAGAAIDISYTYLPALLAAGLPAEAPAVASPPVASGPAVAFPIPDSLFDAAYYLAYNPDVAAAGADPYQHYLTYGWKEGRDPSAAFDPKFYLAANPDVKAAGVDPLLHYETYGWKEGRDPSAAFDTKDYLAVNPDVQAAGIDPLLHYVQHGAAEHRMTFLVPATPDPLVDTAYVYAQHPEVAAAGLDATAWFDTAGWRQGANPDPLFDTNFYLSHNPDVAAAQVDPLLHYETYGWKEGRDPSAVFSTDGYLAAYSDVKAAAIDPLLHYVVFGQAEHRAIFPA